MSVRGGGFDAVNGCLTVRYETEESPESSSGRRKKNAVNPTLGL